MLSAFTILNMLIGVLCEVVSTIARSSKEEEAISIVKRWLLDVLLGVDGNNDGKISREEFNILSKTAYAAEPPPDHPW